MKKFRTNLLESSGNLSRKNPKLERPVFYKTGLSRAFTLVELIVVIVILGVLSTIAFLSFGDYPKQARDSVKIGHLKEIEGVIDLYKGMNTYYPKPTNSHTGKIEGTYGKVWNIGTFGKDTVKDINNLSEIPKNPKTDEEYKYSVSEDGQNYRIEVDLEIENKKTGKKEYILQNKLFLDASSCKEIKNKGYADGDGVYEIGLRNGKRVDVYCDMTTDLGGWTLFGIYGNNNKKNPIEFFNGVGRVESEIGSYKGLSRKTWSVGIENMKLGKNIELSTMVQTANKLQGLKADSVYGNELTFGIMKLPYSYYLLRRDDQLKAMGNLGIKHKCKTSDSYSRTLNTVEIDDNANMQFTDKPNFPSNKWHNDVWHWNGINDFGDSTTDFNNINYTFYYRPDYNYCDSTNSPGANIETIFWIR